MTMGPGRRAFLATGLASLATGCTWLKSRDGMVVDHDTQRMYGLLVSGEPVFTDPTLFPNRRLKLTTRNMSGDPVYDLAEFREAVTQAVLAKGYERSDDRDFGLKLDLNVIRSQQVDHALVKELGIAGGALGGAYGIARQQGGFVGAFPAGILTGATLGAVAGRFALENTYIVTAEVKFGVLRNSLKPRRVITFDGSPRIEEWEETGFGSFRQISRAFIHSYGGAYVISQREVASEVRARLIRSLTDFV
ncbi:MAG: hypothetical protein ACM33T_06865 [Solirubrobacterales bacterium]